MSTDKKTEIQKIEIIPLDVAINGEAKGNIVLYEKSLSKYLEAANKFELKTKEDFGDAKVFVKEIEKQEALLAEAEDKAKNGSQSVSDALAFFASSKKSLSKTRNFLTKQIDAENARIKTGFINESVKSVQTFEASLLDSLDLDIKVQSKKEYLQFLEGAAKNKRTEESVKKSLSNVVSQINEATEQRLNQFAVNKLTIEDQVYQQLFEDKATLLQLPTIKLMAVIKDRNQKEEARIEARLEKIKKEEKEKAEAKAQKELEANQEAERQEQIKKEQIEQERIAKENADKEAKERALQEEGKLQKAQTETSPELQDQGSASELVEESDSVARENPTAKEEPTGEIVDASFEIIDDESTVNENLTVDPMEELQTYKITLVGDWEFQATQESAINEAKELNLLLEPRFGNKVALELVNPLANQQG